jgi:hypothetical protein
MFRRRLVPAALEHAAAVIAFAHSELATLPGNDAVHSMPERLTREPRASQPSVFLVGASATAGDIDGRRFA